MLNKEDVEKVKNRIELLERKMESNLAKIAAQNVVTKAQELEALIPNP